MKHFVLREEAPVIIGTIILLGYSTVIASTKIQELLMQQINTDVFLNKAIQLPAIILGALILLVGLIIGLRRHKDISPLTFALLGIGVLFLDAFWYMPPLIAVLCSVCFVIAGTWNISLPESAKLQSSAPPSFDDFLDNTIISDLENVE